MQTSREYSSLTGEVSGSRPCGNRNWRALGGMPFTIFNISMGEC
jgi:hypothetical protein